MCQVRVVPDWVIDIARRPDTVIVIVFDLVKGGESNPLNRKLPLKPSSYGKK